MKDTEINEAMESGIVAGTPLDVEKFFKLDILEPAANPGYLEPLVLDGERDGELLFVYSDLPGRMQIRFRRSRDAGRTWPEEWTACGDGNEIRGFHISVLRMKSGRLGMTYADTDRDYGHPGRENRAMPFFRSSADGGRTWTDPIRIGFQHACCCTGHGLVLSSGRIVLPSFRWISPIPGNDAEGWILSNNDPSPTLSYSFCYVSDDEGKSWKMSLSELFVSVNRAAYDCEEPTVVELKDGRLLMHLRTELGRMYRSFSKDQGLSWTRPEAMPIAASYTPHMIRRIPSTGDLLMVWNQSSRQELTTGLHRHRLSCAVSKDEGQTWENFKNLESLDDVTVVTPPPVWETRAVGPYESYGYYQPSPGLKRYHRAPGILRICYPTIALTRGEVAIAYDIGYGILNGTGCRLRVIPVEWFTQPSPPLYRKKPLIPFITDWKMSGLLPKGKGVAFADAVAATDTSAWTTPQVERGGRNQGFVNAHASFDDDADGIVYLAAELAVERTGLWRLLIGHDGGVRVFVDGKAVLTSPERINPAVPDRSHADIRLDKGRHALLIALDTDHGMGWGVFARLVACAWRRNRRVDLGNGRAESVCGVDSKSEKRGAAIEKPGETAPRNTSITGQGRDGKIRHGIRNTT